MKPWREVILPRPEARTGGFDESVFAADLSDVVADRGPLEYRDAQTFFTKTYPTRGLVNLLSAVLSRLSGQGAGEPVIQIQTPFGGGKTHSLIALYHLLREGDTLTGLETVSTILAQAGVGSVPKARVATFVGTAADPLGGKTPWGELAEQLGQYELLRQHDLQHRAPGKDLLNQVLGQEPTLLLMDEIAIYAVKARDFADQVMAFFQELTETVKVLPQCALIATLPSSAPYGEPERGERMLQQLESIFGRLEAIYTPVEGEEVYEVIRRRLFEELGDPPEAQRVADGYWEMYRGLREDVPREVRQPAYRNKMRLAYPFHPLLVDTLFERWSTYPTFQRTRGVLRLLAEVVADLYQREHSAPLIQPAHLNLRNPAIRREFIKHIGNEYEGVIASDIADSNAKAPQIDSEMGSEYVHLGIASGLATAIFFGSFSGAERKGIGIQRLRVALLREGIPPAVVGDALGRIEKQLWFLHREGDLYRFSTQPNLNRVKLEKEEAVGREEVTDETRTWVERLAGKELRVTLWPRASQDVADTRDLKLAILSPEHARQAGATSAFVEELLGKYGTTFRTYRNTLLLLLPDSGEMASLRQLVRRLLALRAIRRDKALVRVLSEEDAQSLAGELRDLEGGIPFRLRSAHRHLAKASDAGVEWLDLGLPIVGERGSLAKRVKDYLVSEERLLAKIAPRHVLNKALKEDEQEKPVGDILEAFLKYPQLPMLEGEHVVREAVVRGVSEGTFGVKVGERVHFSEALPLSALEYGAVLVRKELAEQAVQAREGEAILGGAEASVLTALKEAETTGVIVEPQPSLVTGVRAYRLRARVSWDRLSGFVRGVVLPLHGDGAELEVEVLLEARSDSGSIKQSTLEQKVRETLNQIGAEVLEESCE